MLKYYRTFKSINQIKCYCDRIGSNFFTTSIHFGEEKPIYSNLFYNIIKAQSKSGIKLFQCKEDCVIPLGRHCFLNEKSFDYSIQQIKNFAGKYYTDGFRSIKILQIESVNLLNQLSSLCFDNSTFFLQEGSATGRANCLYQHFKFSDVNYNTAISIIKCQNLIRTYNSFFKLNK